MTARCLLCGRFYAERGPEESVCDRHIYDWREMTAAERLRKIRERIYDIAKGGR